MEKLNERSSEKVELHKLTPTYLRNYCLKNSLLLVSFNNLISLSNPALYIQLIIICIDDELFPPRYHVNVLSYFPLLMWKVWRLLGL